MCTSEYFSPRTKCIQIGSISRVLWISQVHPSSYSAYVSASPATSLPLETRNVRESGHFMIEIESATIESDFFPQAGTLNISPILKAACKGADV